MTEDEAEGRVKFDRRISLGNILQLVAMLMAAGALWSTLNADIAVMRSDVERAKVERAEIKNRISAVESSRDDLRERMIRVEIQLQTANDTIKKIAEAVGAR